MSATMFGARKTREPEQYLHRDCSLKPGIASVIHLARVPDISVQTAHHIAARNPVTNGIVPSFHGTRQLTSVHRRRPLL